VSVPAALLSEPSSVRSFGAHGISTVVTPPSHIFCYWCRSHSLTNEYVGARSNLAGLRHQHSKQLHYTLLIFGCCWPAFRSIPGDRSNMWMSTLRSQSPPCRPLCDLSPGSLCCIHLGSDLRDAGCHRSPLMAELTYLKCVTFFEVFADIGGSRRVGAASCVLDFLDLRHIPLIRPNRSPTNLEL